LILRSTVFVALAALLSGVVAADAQTRGANVNITPKRITLDAAHRTGTIFVYNQGDEAGTFNFDLADLVMLPDGQIVPVDSAKAKPDQAPYADKLKSGRSLVVVSPRHVVLRPNQGQTIRLRMADLPDAMTEYRSHLTIANVPDTTAGTTAEEAAQGAGNQFRVVINAVYGLSIPVVLRGPALDVRAEIKNVKLEVVDLKPNPTAPLTPTAVVSFDLLRTGSNSLFGDVAVHYSGQKPDAKPVGIALSMGVYAEIPVRHVRLPLDRRPAPGETVVVTFTDQDSAPGKVLATAGG